MKFLVSVGETKKLRVSLIYYIVCYLSNHNNLQKHTVKTKVCLIKKLIKSLLDRGVRAVG